MRSTQASLFGRTYNAPFGFAPMGGTSMVAYQGDVVLARTAAEATHIRMHLDRLAADNKRPPA